MLKCVLWFEINNKSAMYTLLQDVCNTINTLM